jgi:death-on-curing protein
MLESALARPINKAACGDEDIAEPAAAYLYGLVQNHAFIDGNKRIAISAAAVFLMDNGYEIETSNVRLYAFVNAVTAGEIDKDGAFRFLKDVIITLPG